MIPFTQSDLYFARKIFSVDEQTSMTEIKRIYHKLSRETHPDKHPPELKQKATKKFQELGQAYQILLETDNGMNNMEVEQSFTTIFHNYFQFFKAVKEWQIDEWSVTRNQQELFIQHPKFLQNGIKFLIKTNFLLVSLPTDFDSLIKQCLIETLSPLLKGQEWHQNNNLITIHLIQNKCSVLTSIFSAYEFPLELTDLVLEQLNEKKPAFSYCCM